MSKLNRTASCIGLFAAFVAACAEPAQRPAETGDVRASSAEAASAEAGETRSPRLTVEERAELEQMARTTLDQLIGSNESARELYDRAAYFAVFDSTKVGALVTGAGGSGVAVDSGSNECVYMHMGAGGLGLGAGVQKYKIVFLFEDEEAFDRFVDGRWDGGASAQAVAGKASVEGTSNFVDGLAVYQLTDKGLIAQADLTMMRFWQDRDTPESGQGILQCAS